MNTVVRYDVGPETPEDEISMMTSEGVWCVACVGRRT